MLLLAVHLHSELHLKRAHDGLGRSGVMKATQPTASGIPSRNRYSELKQMLDDRRAEIQAEVLGKMRDVRAEGAWGKNNEVLDAVESAEADIQEDIEFALVQIDRK